ncbi:MAG: disulfide oxidoreductase [Candidatus Moraniibacteriota bacterium]
MTPTISLMLSVLVAIGQAALAIVAVASVLDFKRVRSLAEKYITQRNTLIVAFVVALFSTCGSLYYSEIAGLIPCDLCWFQRIFMYPQVILLGMALWKRDGRIVDYALALAGIGFLFSLYHNFVIYTATQSAFCSFKSVSCTTKTVMSLGYVTIPLMALTAFALILVTFLLRKLGEKKGN